MICNKNMIEVKIKESEDQKRQIEKAKMAEIVINHDTNNPLYRQAIYYMKGYVDKAIQIHEEKRRLTND